MIFSQIWHNYLFEPLLNILIFIYNEFTNSNLGIAVIYLTIVIRIALLPFDFISEKNKQIYLNVKGKVDMIMNDRYTDFVRKREIVRKILRENRVSHWAKGIVLGVQVVVLVVIYQVFLGGMNMEKISASLYSLIYRPDYINTVFLGFELGKRSVYWSLAVAVILYLEIVSEQAERKSILQNSDIIYRYAFPLAAFLLLYYLPMVKSLFILTSLIFSFVIIAISTFIRHKSLKKE